MDVSHRKRQKRLILRSNSTEYSALNISSATKNYYKLYSKLRRITRERTRIERVCSLRFHILNKTAVRMWEIDGRMDTKLL